MNRSLDYRADLYSLGVTLYELFTGELPHDSADPLELVHFHIAGRPVPPSVRDSRACRGSCPTSSIKLLQKEPGDRYQSALGLEADLRRCLAASSGPRADTVRARHATTRSTDSSRRRSCTAALPKLERCCRASSALRAAASRRSWSRGKPASARPRSSRRSISRSRASAATSSPASSISSSRTCRSARSSRPCRISCSSCSRRARKRLPVARRHQRGGSAERATHRRRRAGARAHHRPATARA